MSDMTEDEAARVSPPISGWRGGAFRHNPDRCCASVWHGRGLFPTQCSREPKHTYGKLRYCGQHDPVAVLRRRAESDRKMHEKIEADIARARERERRLAEPAERLRELLKDARWYVEDWQRIAGVGSELAAGLLARIDKELGEK
jgi:hypothetical protein